MLSKENLPRSCLRASWLKGPHPCTVQHHLGKALQTCFHSSALQKTAVPLARRKGRALQLVSLDTHEHRVTCSALRAPSCECVFAIFNSTENMWHFILYCHSSHWKHFWQTLCLLPVTAGLGSALLWASRCPQGSAQPAAFRSLCHGAVLPLPGLLSGGCVGAVSPPRWLFGVLEVGNG